MPSIPGQICAKVLLKVRLVLKIGKITRGKGLWCGCQLFYKKKTKKQNQLQMFQSINFK